MSRKDERVNRAIKVQVAADSFVGASSHAGSWREEDEFEAAVLEAAEEIKAERAARVTQP